MLEPLRLCPVLTPRSCLLAGCGTAGTQGAQTFPPPLGTAAVQNSTHTRPKDLSGAVGEHRHSKLTAEAEALWWIICPGFALQKSKAAQLTGEWRRGTELTEGTSMEPKLKAVRVISYICTTTSAEQQSQALNVKCRSPHPWDCLKDVWMRSLLTWPNSCAQEDFRSWWDSMILGAFSTR